MYIFLSENESARFLRTLSSYQTTSKLTHTNPVTCYVLDLPRSPFPCFQSKTTWFVHHHPVFDHSNNTHYEAPYSAIFSGLLLNPDTFFRTLFLNSLSSCFFLTGQTKFHTQTTQQAKLFCVFQPVRHSTDDAETKYPEPNATYEFHNYRSHCRCMFCMRVASAHALNDHTANLRKHILVPFPFCVGV